MKYRFPLKTLRSHLLPARGVTLLFVILILAALLSIAIGIFNTVYGQLRLSQEITNSFAAFYAADSAMEQALFINRPGSHTDPSGQIQYTNNTCATVTYTNAAGTIDIRTFGRYPANTNCTVDTMTPTVKRALHVAYGVESTTPSNDLAYWPLTSGTLDSSTNQIFSEQIAANDMTLGSNSDPAGDSADPVLVTGAHSFLRFNPTGAGCPADPNPADDDDSFQNCNSKYSFAQYAFQTPENTFTMSFWVYPKRKRVAVTEKVNPSAPSSVEPLANKQSFPLAPTGGGGAGTDCPNVLFRGTGVSVGTNGISVFETGPSCFFSPLNYNATTTWNRWLHVVVVYNSHLPKLYIDGVFIKNGLSQLGVGERPARPPRFFGDAVANGYGRFNGCLSDMRFFSAALSLAEIQTIYNAPAMTDFRHTTPGTGINCT